MWGGGVAPGRGAVKAGRRPAERSLDGSAGSALHYSTMAVAGRPTAGLEDLGWDVTGVRHPANGLGQAAGRIPDGANHNLDESHHAIHRLRLGGQSALPARQGGGAAAGRGEAGLKK